MIAVYRKPYLFYTRIKESLTEVSAFFILFSIKTNPKPDAHKNHDSDEKEYCFDSSFSWIVVLVGEQEETEKYSHHPHTSKFVLLFEELGKSIDDTRSYESREETDIDIVVSTFLCKILRCIYCFFFVFRWWFFAHMVCRVKRDILKQSESFLYVYDIEIHGFINIIFLFLSTSPVLISLQRSLAQISPESQEIPLYHIHERGVLHE